MRVSRLLEIRSDVYVLSPTAKIDKKKVRWADESRQQAASEGNDKVNNNVCEPQKKIISKLSFLIMLLCCLLFLLHCTNQLANAASRIETLPLLFSVFSPCQNRDQRGKD